jgi:vacuolar protein sorting-associated protein 13A/C
MFEKIVEKIIQSCLSDYIQGLESQQLKVSLWSGKIELENVMLNPEILIKLQLPMVFKFTRIRKIDVVIPWSALTTKSVEIKINGIYCVAVPFEMDRWSLNLNYLVEKVKESLKNYEVWWMFEKEKKNAEQGEGKKGYLDEVKNKVLSNLKVFLEDFHLRYEDDFDKNPYSMGVRIKSVKVLPQSLVIQI